MKGFGTFVCVCVCIVLCMCVRMRVCVCIDNLWYVCASLCICGLCPTLIICYVEGCSKMPVLSQMWASLSTEEKEQWKEKAKGFSWISTPEQKKKAIRELVTLTRENVSLYSRGSY